jgi:hypothetical protein
MVGSLGRIYRQTGPNGFFTKSRASDSSNLAVVLLLSACLLLYLSTG